MAARCASGTRRSKLGASAGVTLRATTTRTRLAVAVGRMSFRLARVRTAHRHVGPSRKSRTIRFIGSAKRSNRTARPGNFRASSAQHGHGSDLGARLAAMTSTTIDERLARRHLTTLVFQRSLPAGVFSKVMVWVPYGGEAYAL